MRHRFAFLLIAISAALSSAEQFTLKDGRVLVGTYDEASQVLTIESPKAAMHVDARDIVKREEAPQAPAEPKKERPALTADAVRASIASLDKEIAALSAEETAAANDGLALGVPANPKDRKPDDPGARAFARKRAAQEKREQKQRQRDDLEAKLTQLESAERAASAPPYFKDVFDKQAEAMAASEVLEKARRDAAEKTNAYQRANAEAMAKFWKEADLSPVVVKVPENPSQDDLRAATRLTDLNRKLELARKERDAGRPIGELFDSELVRLYAKAKGLRWLLP